MSKPLAAAPDAERVTVDYLTTAMAARGETCTVGVVIPTVAWTPTTTSHVQVALDGTPVVQYPVMESATVRVTAWAGTTTEAKRLLRLSLALLLAHPGGSGVGSVRPLTGCLPATDPVTKAQLASGSVRMNLRMSVL